MSMDFLAATSVPLATPTFQQKQPDWCVLIVDDEPEVHLVTRLALRDFEFQNRGLELVSAYSAAEAMSIFEQRSDIALALVDVVMENEHAGLELVRHVREANKNHMTRLVLRTGQAGQAPEDRVIRDYDIDDYREKTDLTTQKMRTLLYSALRSYRDLVVIESQRDGLTSVIKACAEVQNVTSFKQFAKAVLQQLISLLHLDRSALYCIQVPGNIAAERHTRILVATGEFINYDAASSLAALPSEVADRLNAVIARQSSMHFSDAYVLHTQGAHGSVNLLYITHSEPISEIDQQLLEIFTFDVAITFSNITLLEDLQDTAKEMVYTLADAVEARSKETGAHVQRVALVSELLAQHIGVSEHEIMLIKNASPLHDIGKVAIPDDIMNKPAKLTPEEWAVMQKHVEFGVAILRRSQREVMRMGATIAANHHERWDGAGYPQGLHGEEIPLVGRITALADVFDALSSKRSYKEPWESKKILEYIIAQKGLQFDPALVDVFVTHYDECLAIFNSHPDSGNK